MSTNIAFDIIARDRASSTFNRVARSADGVSASSSRAGSMMGKFGALAKVGATGALAAGAGLAVIGKNAVGLEMQFSKTMNVLGATLKAPQEEVKKLSDLALKMGADTVFSANDASKAMLELARGGISAASIQAGALEGTLTLAAAGEMSMAEAANVAVKSMGQFNLAGKDASKVAAALAGGANASSASVADMSQALAQGGLAANSVGFSLQETTAVLAAFSNAGLEGSDAGTSLKTMLDRLQPTTNAASTAMQKLGVITKDGTNRFIKANGEFRSAAEIAEILKQGTEKLTESEQKRLITQAFGSDAQRAATVFAEEGAAGLEKLTKATSDQSAAEKMAAANMEGTAGAMERLKGAVETAQLKIGLALAPAVIYVADALSEKVIPAVTGFIDGLVKGGGAADRLRPIVLAVGGALQDLGKWVMSDLVPAIRGLAKHIAEGAHQAFQMLKGSGDEVKNILRLIGDVITKVVIPAVGWLAKNVLPVLAAQFRISVEIVSKLIDIARGAWRAFKAGFAPILGIIQPIIDKIQALINKMREAKGEELIGKGVIHGSAPIGGVDEGDGRGQVGSGAGTVAPPNSHQRAVATSPRTSGRVASSGGGMDYRTMVAAFTEALMSAQVVRLENAGQGAYVGGATY